MMNSSNAPSFEPHHLPIHTRSMTDPMPPRENDDRDKAPLSTKLESNQGVVPQDDQWENMARRGSYEDDLGFEDDPEILTLSVCLPCRLYLLPLYLPQTLKLVLWPSSFNDILVDHRKLPKKTLAESIEVFALLQRSTITGIR